MLCMDVDSIVVLARRDDYQEDHCHADRQQSNLSQNKCTVKSLHSPVFWLTQLHASRKKFT